MGWFDQMARSAPSIPTPPGSQALSAVTGGPQAANGMAGMFSGGAPAGPNSVLGLMGGQLLNQQPQMGSLSALGGGGLNQVNPWDAIGGTRVDSQPIAAPPVGAMAGGFNGPQPVPGQPPRMMQPPLATSQPMPWDFSGGATTDQGMPGGENGRGPGGPFYQPSPFKFPSDPNDPRYQPGGDLYFDPSRSSEGPGGLTGHAQDPGYWQLGGNRGSGQPINQPNLGMADNPTAPVRQPGFVAPDPSQMAYTTGMGSLQSLGGGQLNQSGMVTLRAPDGSQTKAVPADQVAHWLSRGAVRV